MEGFKSFKKVQCFKEGGSVKYQSRNAGKKEMHEDIAEDKKLIKKAFKQHDKAEHDKADASEIKLKKGGRAKKEKGTVTKYKDGGKVSNVYEAKKKAGDLDNIQKVKDIKAVKLCGGKSVKKMADGGQPGASAAQKKYYADNKAKAQSAATKADYEAFGSRGDAARKGMEEGRMDAQGTAYKKGGKIKKMADGGVADALLNAGAAAKGMGKADDLVYRPKTPEEKARIKDAFDRFNNQNPPVNPAAEYTRPRKPGQSSSLQLMKKGGCAKK